MNNKRKFFVIFILILAVIITLGITCFAQDDYRGGIDNSLSSLQKIMENKNVKKGMKYGIPIIILFIVFKIVYKAITRHIKEGYKDPKVLEQRRKKEHIKEAEQYLKSKNYLAAAHAFERGGDLQNALEMFKKGRDHSNAARIYERMGLFENAALYYERVKKYEEAARCYQKRGKFNLAGSLFEKANKIFFAAEMFEKAHNYEEAARLYLKNNFFEKAGDMLVKANQFGKAAELFEELYIKESSKMKLIGDPQYLSTNSKVKRLALRASELYLKTNDFEKAAEIYIKVGEHLKAAEIYLKANMLEKAVNIYAEHRRYQEAAKLYKEMGNDKKYYEMMALYHISISDLAEAAHMYEKAEEYIKAAEIYERAGSFFNASEMAILGGDYEKAGDLLLFIHEDLRAAQAFEMAKQYERAAKLYLKLKDFSSAIKNYEKAGNFLEAGYILAERGEIDKAIATVQKAPSSKKVELFLGQLFAKKGAYNFAREKYLKALSDEEPSTTNIDYFYEYGIVLEKSEKLKEALEVFEKILTIDISYRDVNQRIKRLKYRIETEKRNKVVKRYVPIEEIGQGSMGLVYKAKDNVLDRIVAYKVLPDYLKESKEHLEDFKREAKIIATLNHPYIVTLYDIIEDEGDICLIMEFIEGLTLKEILDKRRTLPPYVIKNMVLQICSALDYAHSKNIVHRDIKPANIMVTKNNIIKIMDFGIAKIVEKAMMSRTSIKGTPLYMSPEQIRGEPVDPRYDIYSLGCIMYQMSTGDPPFTHGEVLYHHLHTIPKEPKSINPSTPEWLNKVIMKSIEKDKTKRYQKISEIIMDLDLST